ncbi:uncharacterized protein LOC134671147 [Cydia fagiglandana]|uniref:uncharacterized protein LOC134671147 n=1 Tax=Cydia fagiglandana TaxID=1458189 RepID=UPI002FEE05B0
MIRVTHQLDYLRLAELDNGWVEAIYFSEFLEFGEFPEQYALILENVEIRSVFRKIMSAVDEWLRDSSSEEEKSWALLSREVNPRKLLAFLAYYIDNGSKNIMSHEHRNTALLAARVYFKMLSIPGYKAYHIYHSQLFAQSLGCLGYPKIICENEDNYFNLKQLTREVNSVIKSLSSFVKALRAVIDALHLTPTDMNFEDILSNLVEFTGGAIVNKLDIDKIELANISQVIYEMIDILLCDSDGDPKPEAIQLLFKCLLPKLVAASVDNKSATNLVRASYVTYSGLILTKYGNSALSAFITLLQHLCYTCDGLERAEVRSARVSLVIGLMSILPQKSYRFIVRWILKLSNTAKVSHRHIALELIGQLLNNDPEESAAPPPPTEPPAAVSSENQESVDQSSNQPENADTTAAPSNQEVSDNQNITTMKIQNTSTPLPNCYVVLSRSPGIENATKTVPYDNLTPGPSGTENTAPTDDPMTGDPTPGISGTKNTAPTDDPMTGDPTPGTSGTKNTAPTDDPMTGDPTPGTSGTQNTVQISPVPGPSGLQINDSQSTDSIGPEIFDSGIQDPTTGLDTECDDYIMSLLNNENLPDLPGPIELGDIDLQFAMFNELNNQINEANQVEATPVKDVTVELATTDKEVVLVEPATPVKEDPPIEATPQKKKGKSKKGRASAAEAPPPEPVPIDDESSQEHNPDIIAEGDIAGLLRQRPHTVPHAELLRAVYDRVNDVSSTLRTRALALLSDCLASPRPPLREAVSELNGSGAVSRLMVVAARCVSDERAAVRKAAVALVHRELVDGPPPQPNDLGILVSLCRDASIIVRSAAIASLGEIVVKRPSDDVLDAFLAGPMHQMSDPETKVQELVVNLMQQVAFDRLQKQSSLAAESPLPWQFLAAITRHNMRRHLQKACVLLAKTSKCINHRVVDAVSTHLGVQGDERDLQCLVLLTSIARLVDYSDVTFILDYYYSLVDNTQGRDQRLKPLTLELLTLWSRYLTPSDRTALREHLAARLATASGEDGCRIPSATLAAHLDPTNLQWANELLQLSEKRALSGGGVSEWVRAADLSLVAPAPPSPALLTLFLTALRDPPAEWSASWHGAAVAGLGRLCVRSRGAAAAAAPALAAILHSSQHALQARVNALLALADICVRYTNIVEPLLGNVSMCLNVSAPAALRRSAARSLTRLLLAGFLRLRPPLYYRYCALLADSDADVREPAEYYLTSCLTSDAIYHHFVDCIKHYNSSRSGIIDRASVRRTLTPTEREADSDADVREPAEYYLTSCLTSDAIYHHFVDCIKHYNSSRSGIIDRASVRRTLTPTEREADSDADVREPAEYYLTSCLTSDAIYHHFDDCIKHYNSSRSGIIDRASREADSDADVREPAEYYLTSCLTSDAIYHHFVDCIKHYNSSRSGIIDRASREADSDADVREPAEYYLTSCLTSDAIYHHFVDCIKHYNSSRSGIIDRASVRRTLTPIEREADSDADVREPAEYYLTSCLTSDAIYHHFVDCIKHYNSSRSGIIDRASREADSDADVREPAEYYLTSCLTSDAIYHHFVDCIKHYNSSRSESISFDARQLIYDVMLQRFSIVQKLNVQCRLAREVLENAAEWIEENGEEDKPGGPTFEPDMAATLLDTITLLCGARMKLPKKPDKSGDVADIDDLQERVTTNIVSHKMKRTVAEVLVPAVLRLHAKVKCGQISTYLVRIANELLVDYRQEIEELIENDETLVGRMKTYQELIGVDKMPAFGNTRNLVTTSAPPEPDTPRARRRPARQSSGPPRKRALRI